MNNKLLILNLGVDAENTSLAFTQKWINELSLNYVKVDVITLKKGEKYKLNENVSLHYVNKNDSSYSKFHQLKILSAILINFKFSFFDPIVNRNMFLIL